VKKAVGLAG